MRDLLVFTVQDNRYAIDLENVQRIIEVPELTMLPNAHPAASEIVSYESQVIRVIDFRKLIAIETREEELVERFEQFYSQQKAWFEAVTESIVDAREFEGNTDPSQCSLGRWISGFISYDENVSAALKQLGLEHKKLYAQAVDILRHSKTDNKTALLLLQTRLHDTYKKFMASLERFGSFLDSVAASLQKMLICRRDSECFALKVDAIVDIVSVDEVVIKYTETGYAQSRFFEIEGVVEIDGMLVNMIKSITIPKREAA